MVMVQVIAEVYSLVCMYVCLFHPHLQKIIHRMEHFYNNANKIQLITVTTEIFTRVMQLSYALYILTKHSYNMTALFSIYISICLLRSMLEKLQKAYVIYMY